MAEVITVSALNRYVKTLLDANDALFDLALRGEIANFVQNARSGHCYFSLRDDACSVKAVMFRTDARRLAFRPEEGMRVVVRCRATLYERDGAFQLYVNDMFPDGIGAAQLALEQLKAKLEQEGLFAPEHKKPLPAFPKCIGVVTSKTGAALQDIRNVLTRRWPSVRLLLCPVTVQGFEAAQQVAACHPNAGSARKRWTRSSWHAAAAAGKTCGSSTLRMIARAAYRCKTPLISAIGHEIDYTILDFVADQRAPTPSAAAELAVPDREEQQRILLKICSKIFAKICKNGLMLCYNGLEQYNFVLEQSACTPKSGRSIQSQLQQVQQAIRQQMQKARMNDCRICSCSMRQHLAGIAGSIPVCWPAAMRWSPHAKGDDSALQSSCSRKKQSMFAALPAVQSAGWKRWRRSMRTPKSFEEGMERLNTLLAQMQSEDTTLADSVKLYAEAASLMEYCHAALEKTSLQIERDRRKACESTQVQEES